MNRYVFITLGVIYIDIHHGSSYMEVTTTFLQQADVVLAKNTDTRMNK